MVIARKGDELFEVEILQSQLHGLRVPTRSERWAKPYNEQNTREASCPLRLDLGVYLKAYFIPQFLHTHLPLTITA